MSDNINNAIDKIYIMEEILAEIVDNINDCERTTQDITYLVSRVIFSVLGVSDEIKVLQTVTNKLYKKARLKKIVDVLLELSLKLDESIKETKIVESKIIDQTNILVRLRNDIESIDVVTNESLYLLEAEVCKDE